HQKKPKVFQAFKLYDIDYAVQSWSCTDADGRTFTVVHKYSARRKVPVVMLLEAEQSQTKNYAMTGVFQVGDARAEALPPGKYKVTVTIHLEASKAAEPPTGVGYWTGDLVTAPVEIEIVK